MESGSEGRKGQSTNSQIFNASRPHFGAQSQIFFGPNPRFRPQSQIFFGPNPCFRPQSQILGVSPTQTLTEGVIGQSHDTRLRPNAARFQ